MIGKFTRRDILQTAIAASLGGWSLPASSATDDLSGHTLVSAAQAIRSGEISAEDYANALIAKCNEHESLNAFISFDPDAVIIAAREADRITATGAALGPLHGVPLVLKDNIETSGLPATSGTGALRNYRPERNATAAQRLFDAGALLLGKTNMHELAAGITSNNDVFGPVRNPWNPDMIPGGSSGGTAVAITAHMAPAGLGTDTGASTRNPAALCGIAGMRPTQGRYADDGHVPFRSATATIGPMARNAADLGLLDSIMAGADSSLPDLLPGEIRLGLPRSPFRENVDEAIAPLLQDTYDLLEQSGITLVREEITGHDELLASDAGMLSRFESRRQYMAFFTATGISAEEYISQIGNASIRNRLERSLLGPAENVPDDREASAGFRAGARSMLSRYFADNRLDGMLFPTAPLAARPIGQEQTVELNGEQVSTFQIYIRNTAVGSAAGVPGISVPAGLSPDRLPVGIEIDGPFGSDQRLLAIASVIESILPPLPPPPLS